MNQAPLIVRISLRVYQSLLLLYPHSFRSEFGAEMTLLFEELISEGWHRSGWLGLGITWIRVLGDIATSVPKQQWGAYMATNGMHKGLGASFSLALTLIVVGWLVDYNSHGDPHWLDGCGIVLLVVGVLTVAAMPAQSEVSSPIGPARSGKRSIILAAGLLSVAVAGIVHAFVAEYVSIGDHRRPLTVSPVRELLAVASLATVFALTYTVLRQIREIPQPRRRDTLLVVTGWGLAGFLAVIVAAFALAYGLMRQDVRISLDLLAVLILVVGLPTLLLVAKLMLYLCKGSSRDRREA